MTAELFAFTQTAPPCKGDLRTLAETIHRRLLGLMKRRGMLGKETISNGEQQLDALAACGQLCIGGERERSGQALSVVMPGTTWLWS